MSHRKALELVNHNTLLNHMLVFLQACPFKFVSGMPEERSATTVYQERFDALLPCLLTPNEHVRRSAAAVLDRAFTNKKVLEEWHRSETLTSFPFKEKVWKLT